MSPRGFLGLIGVGLATGLTLLAMIYAFAHVSGAHFNPAITFAMAATRRIKGEEALGYVLAQLLGSILAAILLVTIVPRAAVVHIGVTDVSVGVSWSAAVLAEAVMTFLLVTVIFALAVDRRGAGEMIGLAVFGVVASAHISIGVLTGAALNPARAFGPALVSGYWATQSVYWFGPLMGAFAAALAYEYALRPKRGHDMTV